MGLLSLNPDAAYGLDGRPYSISTRYWVERPRLGNGTTMEAGVVFGMRSPEDFYLAHVSVLHDVVVLERYVHGRKRDNREERLRTGGNEWHDLSVRVDGDSATVVVDGREVFREGGLQGTSGGAALWARVTASACFSEARVDA
jgi:hypothetical protein